MKFEWDEGKRQANIEKHDVDLLEAALIFENWVLVQSDTRFDYGETRFRSIGIVGDDLYVVVYTWRLDTIRLVSAWKGGRRDRRKYQAGYARRNSSDEG